MTKARTYKHQYRPRACDPAAFIPIEHLDYFVIWYHYLVCMLRHPRKPQLDNTIQQIGHDDVMGFMRVSDLSTTWQLIIRKLADQ